MERDENEKEHRRGFIDIPFWTTEFARRKPLKLGMMDRAGNYYDSATKQNMEMGDAWIKAWDNNNAPIQHRNPIRRSSFSQCNRRRRCLTNQL
jgi:hypothetical protein